MSFSPMQTEYLMHCNHRWNVKSGATRSGKTFVDTAVVIPKRILKCQGNGLIMLLGNTKGTLERNILEPMRKLWTSNLIGNIGSNNTVQIFGHKVYALGADKVSQVSKLQGAAFEYCYGDEVTTWSEEVFQMLKSRLSCANSCFDGTCNPDNPQHWFKAFLDSGADIYQQAYTIDDNPFLTDEFVRNLKQEYAGTVYYDRYILGKWRRAEGLVYPSFDIVQNVAKSVPEEGLYYISIDYGTLNPCSMGLWCLTETVAVRVSEYYWDGRKRQQQKTDEEYYADLKELAGDRVIQDVIVDPSAASFMECIRRHGRFRVVGANNKVLDGIRYTNTLIASRRILITEACKDILREFHAYVWDESSGQDQVIKDNDHAMDDMRYFAMSILHSRFRW